MFAGHTHILPRPSWTLKKHNENIYANIPTYSLVQCPLLYKIKQSIIDERQVFLGSSYYRDNDIVSDGLLWVMWSDPQVFWKRRIGTITYTSKTERQKLNTSTLFCNGFDADKFKHLSSFTSEVFGQVWVVHETMTGKLNTLQSDWNMDVVKPFGKREILMAAINKTR